MTWLEWYEEQKPDDMGELLDVLVMPLLLEAEALFPEGPE